MKDGHHHLTSEPDEHAIPSVLMMAHLCDACWMLWNESGSCFIRLPADHGASLYFRVPTGALDLLIRPMYKQKKWTGKAINHHAAPTLRSLECSFGECVLGLDARRCRLPAPPKSHPTE